MDPSEIRSLIEQNLHGSRADVQTDGQGHYEATVVCAAFADRKSTRLNSSHPLHDALPISWIQAKFVP